MGWDEFDQSSRYDEDAGRAEREAVREPEAKRDSEPERPSVEFAPLIVAFREQLMACLEECARGRRGLFSDRGHLDDGDAWPEAARLRDLAFALQSILAQSEESDVLCDQFLDLCSIHGESDPGEPRLARAFLSEIAGGG
jgi:hypothetical protein